MTDKPHLTLVDPSFSADHDLEFAPLPCYNWDERPSTVELTSDEVATAIHIAKADLVHAARLLKVPLIRLQRLLKQSPRLQRIYDESLGLVLAQAASVPIQTLFNPDADQRAKEWASTKVLQSKLAQNHPLSPAPPSTTQSASLTVSQPQKTITFRWQDDGHPTIDGDGNSPLQAAPPLPPAAPE